MSKPSVKETKDRKNPIRVFVTRTERAAIEDQARALHLSLSSYLCARGICAEKEALIDYQTQRALLQVNADLGRLGGLLKLWLSQRPNQGAPACDVRTVLKDIERSQDKLRSIIDSFPFGVVKGRDAKNYLGGWP